MKKTHLFLAILVFLFGSCKKKYTCECNTTITYYDTRNQIFVTEVIPASKGDTYPEKMTEKQARAACQHEETADQTSLSDWNTTHGQYVYKKGESLTTSCGLK